MGLWVAVSIAVIVSILSESGIAVIGRLPPVIFNRDSDESRSCALNMTSVHDELNTSIQDEVNRFIKNINVSNFTGRSAVCGGQGWTKVAVINMSDSTNDCPSEFTTYDNPTRSCGRSHNYSITITSFKVNQSYSSVCGRILAIQSGSPDGFNPYFNNPGLLSVFDGIALAYGTRYSLDTLIWFFVGSPSHFPANERKGCPCDYKQWNYSLPSNLGSNYFCQSANPSAVSDTEVFLDNPLWNGEGCASNSTCCQFNNPPWFFTDLEEPTTTDIRMVLFLNGPSSEKNLFITNIDLYVSNIDS